MAVSSQIFAAPAAAASTTSPEDQAVLRDVSIFFSGSSRAITLLHEQIRRVAPYFRTAVLTGERDCGEKEVAFELHQLSPLSGQAFVELSSTEAETLFAHRGQPNAMASEGMLFLPRPERIPQAVQKALLRMLRERGPNTPRVVAFAERGLRSLVSMGSFSGELAESLNALRIVLPPLRDRREDVPGLLIEMVREIAEQQGIPIPQLGADLLRAASRQTWPGNFGQLRAVALSLVNLAASGPLGVSDFEAVLGTMPAPPRRDRREIRMVTLDRIMHEHIRSVLFACNGNKLRAAEVLGISRSTLYRMLESEIPGASTSVPALDSIEPGSLGPTSQPKKLSRTA
jgi:DNA-binding NtrC family response regulator